MLIASKDKQEISKLKRSLRGEFDMKDMGVTRKILGIEIIRDRGKRKLFLSQQNYLEKVLVKSGMGCQLHKLQVMRKKSFIWKRFLTLMWWVALCMQWFAQGRI